MDRSIVCILTHASLFGHQVRMLAGETIYVVSEDFLFSRYTPALGIFTLVTAKVGSSIKVGGDGVHFVNDGHI